MARQHVMPPNTLSLRKYGSLMSNRIVYGSISSRVDDRLEIDPQTARSPAGI